MRHGLASTFNINAKSCRTLCSLTSSLTLVLGAVADLFEGIKDRDLLLAPESCSRKFGLYDRVKRCSRTSLSRNSKTKTTRAHGRRYPSHPEWQFKKRMSMHPLPVLQGNRSQRSFLFCKTPILKQRLYVDTSGEIFGGIF